VTVLLPIGELQIASSVLPDHMQLLKAVAVKETVLFFNGLG